MVEQPAQEKRSRRRHWLSIGATAIGAVALILAGYSGLKPNDRSSYSAPAQRLAAAPRGVTYDAIDRLYIVADPDGTFVALDEQDRMAANRQNGCVIRWRSDVEGGVFLQDARCGDATFDRQGVSPSGGLPLLRHLAKLAGKRVVVDIRQCMAPENGAVRACKTFHT